MPLPDACMDAAWAWDVMEHVRYPELTVSELARVLAPGGVFLARVDLRDHRHLDEIERWLDHLAHRRLTWHLMTWNRTSFVNRLLLSDWRRLFAESGLEVAELVPDVEERLRALARLPHLSHLDEEDLVTWSFVVVLRKPQ